MVTLIKNGTVVNEGQQVKADIIIENDIIKDILREGTGDANTGSFDSVIDAEGGLVMPGVIDAHVHFREPGMTHKADMKTESRAAVYGGVTSVFEMPNTNPQTTTLEALEEKERLATERMSVNYAFFPGATNDNLEQLRLLDVHRVPGIKLFMGSSTGNMLVDKEQALDGVFALAKQMNLPIMAHCEDTDTINENMAKWKEMQNTDDPDIRMHMFIRSEEACYKSSALACKLAERHGTQLHIAHVTTEMELPLLKGNVTGEATVAHLNFSAEDYATVGARIKCNPAIKSVVDQVALRNALKVAAEDAAVKGLCTVGTDHAPHALEEKQGGCAKAMSGMPMIQFSLVTMLEIMEECMMTPEQLVQVMCHNPARLFQVNERGFLRKGYKADVVIVRRDENPWTLTADMIQSKCGWSPLEGREFHWKVMHTLINGRHVYNNGEFDDTVRGEHISFR